MHQLRDAVMARDANAILARSSAQTHQRLAELHTLLKEQRQAIAERYPEEHRAAARTAYPPGVLEAADTEALFQALVTSRLAALETTDGLRYGLTVMGTPTTDGEHSQVSTQSGETFEFVLEDGRYVTTTFERTLARNLERARIYQQTLTELGWKIEGAFGLYEATKDELRFSMMALTTNQGKTLVQIRNE